MSPRRLGKTLIELLVIISILSLVIGMSVTSLGTLFRLRQQFQRDREQAAALARLGTRLRTDAHEAVSATVGNALRGVPSAENDACVLNLADGRTIHYEFAPPRMVRRVQRDATTLHRDTFLLPRTATATFEREGDSPKSLIRLSIRPVETRLPPRDLPRAATIEACVGLNQALAQNARQP